MSYCQARPLEGHQHTEEVADYVRICPAGHIRSGKACTGCAGNGAILCDECEDGAPAIVVRAEVFWPSLERLQFSPVIGGSARKIGREWCRIVPGTEGRLISFGGVNEDAAAWIDTRPERAGEPS